MQHGETVIGEAEPDRNYSGILLEHLKLADITTSKLTVSNPFPPGTIEKKKKNLRTFVSDVTSDYLLYKDEFLHEHTVYYLLIPWIFFFLLFIYVKIDCLCISTLLFRVLNPTQHSLQD